MKKMMALLLCLCMAASLAAPAFATADAADVLSADLESVADAVATPIEETPEKEIPAEEIPAEIPAESPAPSEPPVEAPVVEQTNTADTLQVEPTAKPREDTEDDGSGDGTGEETPDREKTPVPDSGNLTDTITWSLDENYVLTVSGTGEIPDFEHSTKTPWADHRLSITKIHVGEGITRVGDYTFDWCSNVTETTLPSTLISIGEWSFGNGSTGTTIALPMGLKTIEKNAFHLNKLTSVTLPLTIKSVGDNAFAGGRIKDITLPNADYISYPFANNAVEIVTLEEGHTTIPACMAYFTAMVTLNLPSTIETMDSDFLRANTKLENIHTTPDLDASHRFLGWQDENGHMFLTDELIAGNTECFYPTGVVTAIWVPVEGGTSGTVKDTSITWSVDMTNGVLTISGTGAMPDFASLKDVPWAIFASYVKKIVVEKDVTTVGANAFESFLAVTEVSLADGITSIGNSAFSTCTGLTSISLPNTVTVIGEDAFNWCTRLKTVTLSTGLKTIGDSAFYYCKAMTAITLPASLESIGKNAFESCTGLTAIHFPAGLKTIGQDAFLGCIALTDVTMAKNAADDSLTCWIDETGTPYANSQIPEAGYLGTLTAFWGLFSDVSSRDWFYDYVMYCYEEGIMQGTNVGIFEPYGGATRAQVVTVLYRLANTPAVTGASSFTDVPENQWFTDAVIWAAEEGIAMGYGDDTFNPYGYVTREEFLVFLDRFVTSLGYRKNVWSDDFDLTDYELFAITDADSISSWAMESETWSYLIGLQSGYDNGNDTYSLNPRGAVTRAELATFLCRYDENHQLFTNAEACQILVGYSTAAAIQVFKKEPNNEDKIKLEDDLVWWSYDNYGIMLLIDYSESKDGIIVAWDYTNIL